MTKAEFRKQVKLLADLGAPDAASARLFADLKAMDPELGRLLEVNHASCDALADYCKARIAEIDANGRK